MNLFRLTLGGVLAAGITLCGAQVFAQDQTPAPAPDQTAPQTQAGHHHRQMDPDRAVARMTKRYTLSQDQQNQIKPILTDEQQQMESLNQDSSLSPSDKRSKRRSIHSDANSKIEAVLNDQQKQKFDADQQRMQEHRGHHGAPSSDNTAPAPPPQ